MLLRLLAQSKKYLGRYLQFVIEFVMANEFPRRIDTRMKNGSVGEVLGGVRSAGRDELIM